MLTTRSLSPQRALSIWAIGVVPMVALLGHFVLLAPPASADCVMTAGDERYILLAEKNIVDATGYTDCHVTAGGAGSPVVWGCPASEPISSLP